MLLGGRSAFLPLKEAGMKYMERAGMKNMKYMEAMKYMGGAGAKVCRRTSALSHAAPAVALAALLGRKVLAQKVVAPAHLAGGRGGMRVTHRPAFPAAGCLVHAPHPAHPMAVPGGGGAARGLSSGADKDVVIYSSKFESVLRAISAGSVAQGGVFALMAAAVSLHPAAANSSLLPGWTASGRGALSGVLIGFGAAVVLGCKGFLGKQILKVCVCV
jgi:hypothetical protein